VGRGGLRRARRPDVRLPRRRRRVRRCRSGLLQRRRRRDTYYGGKGIDDGYLGVGRDFANLGPGKDFLGDLTRDGARDRIKCGPGHDRITYLEHRDRKDVLTDCEEVSVIVID
jgi:hypothetical protein